MNQQSNTSDQETASTRDEFGKLLREARKKAGLTQQELGKSIGVSGNAIVQYERGRAKPRHKPFTLLLKKLKVDASYFISKDIDEKRRLFFAERLKKARKEKGLTQEELGDKVGLSGKSIAQYEAGRAYPRQKPFGLLLEELEVSSSYLLTGYQPEEKIRAQTRYEKSALEILREVDPKKQKLLVEMMEAFAKAAKGDSSKKAREKKEN